MASSCAWIISCKTDDFMSLQALQELDVTDMEALADFKGRFHLDDEAVVVLSQLDIPSVREIQIIAPLTMISSLGMTMSGVISRITIRNRLDAVVF